MPTRLQVIARLTDKARTGVLDKAELAQLERAQGRQAEMRLPIEQRIAMRSPRIRALRARAVKAKARPYCEHPEACRVVSPSGADHCRQCAGKQRAALGRCGRRYAKA